MAACGWAVGRANADGSSPNKGAVSASAQAQSPTDFMRMLAFVPAPLDRWQYQITYAAPGTVRARWGIGDAMSYVDLQAGGVSTAQFASVLSACFDSPFAYNGLDTQGTERDAFGFDFYQVAREICAGEPPMVLDTHTMRDQPAAFARVEGAFDPDAVAVALHNAGYIDADHVGLPYFTTLDDNAEDLMHIQSRLFPARRNRLAVNDARIIAAPTTLLMADALDAEAGRVPTLDNDPALRALAFTLGDVTSVATLPPDYTDRSIAAARAHSRNSIGTAQVIARGLRENTGDWQALRPPALLAVAFTDASVLRRTLHLVRVYTNPPDATADVAGVTARLSGYQIVPGGGNALAPPRDGAALFTVGAETYAGRGVLFVDAPLMTTADLNPAWVQTTVQSLIPAFALDDPDATARRLEADVAASTP